MQYAHHEHHSLVSPTLLRLARLVTPKSTSQDAGLTLVECIMAIVVVGFVGASWCIHVWRQPDAQLQK